MGRNARHYNTGVDQVHYQTNKLFFPRALPGPKRTAAKFLLHGVFPSQRNCDCSFSIKAEIIPSMQSVDPLATGKKEVILEVINYFLIFGFLDLCKYNQSLLFLKNETED